MNDNKATGGITFLGLLTIAFIVLKLMGVINWSWLWVFSPIWIPGVMAMLFLVMIVVLFKK